MIDSKAGDILNTTPPKNMYVYDPHRFDNITSPIWKVINPKKEETIFYKKWSILF